MASLQSCALCFKIFWREEYVGGGALEKGMIVKEIAEPREFLIKLCRI
jgi:hypothetical protein